MRGLLIWLGRRRWFTIPVACVYLALVSFGHDRVCQLSFRVQDLLTREVYNRILTIGLLLLLVPFALVLWSGLRRGPQGSLKAFYWITTVILIGVCYQTTFVMNIEVVHVLQYALLAVLILALTRRMGETVLWVTLLGALDEAIQYWVIYGSRNSRYDFNDALLNLLGAGLGVVTLAIVLRAGAPADEGYSWKRWIRSPALVTTAVLLGVVAVLACAGWLGIYPAEIGPNAVILLSREQPPSAYWLDTQWGKVYHIIHPYAGLLAMAVLTVWYVWLDMRVDLRSRLGTLAKPAEAVDC